MRKTISLCCGCAVPAYPCRGSLCPLREVEVLVCDECDSEEETLYIFEGQELCIDCIKDRLETVT